MTRMVNTLDFIWPQALSDKLLVVVFLLGNSCPSNSRLFLVSQIIWKQTTPQESTAQCFLFELATQPHLISLIGKLAVYKAGVTQSWLQNLRDTVTHWLLVIRRKPFRYLSVNFDYCRVHGLLQTPMQTVHIARLQLLLKGRNRRKIHSIQLLPVLWMVWQVSAVPFKLLVCCNYEQCKVKIILLALPILGSATATVGL